MNVDVAKKREKVSIAFADAKEAEDENGRILAMARQVEAEVRLHGGRCLDWINLRIRLLIP